MAASLSDDILIEVFKWSHAADIVRCRQVCRMYRDIIDLAEELQYKLDLYAAGCIEWDIPGSTIVRRGFDERRKLLRQHMLSRSFANLAWYPLHEPSSLLEEILRPGPGFKTFYSGNVFVSTRLSGPVAQNGAAPAQQTLVVRCTTLVARNLPYDSAPGTALRFEVEATEWTMNPVKPFSSIAVDHIENLLVLIQDYRGGQMMDGSNAISVCLGIRQCALWPQVGQQSPNHHPEHFVDVFGVGLTAESIHTGARARGNALALVVMARYPNRLSDQAVEIIFCDRSTVAPFARYKIDYPHTLISFDTHVPFTQRTQNFLFLDESTFLLVLFGSTTLIEVYTLSHTAFNESVCVLVATFVLPTHHAECSTIWSDARMTCTSWHGEQHASSSARPGAVQIPLGLTADISDCLLMVTYELFNPSVVAPRRILPIGRRKLVSSTLKLTSIFSLVPFLNAAEAYRANGEDDRRIPWALWGPKYSRTVPSPLRAFGSGSRVLVCGEMEEDHIWDFNIRLHLRDVNVTGLPTKDNKQKRWWSSQSHRIGQGSRTRFIGRDQPSVVPQGDFLQDDIVGSLPYYETRCPPVPGLHGRETELLRGSPIVMAVGDRNPWNDGLDKLYALNI